MNVHFRKSIGAKFLLVAGAFAVVFSCFVLYRTWSQGDAHTEELLARQTELALAFDLATFASTAKNSLVLIVGLCFLLAAIYLTFHYLVSRKLAVIAGHFRDAVAREDDAPVTPIVYDGHDEIGDLVASFNLLAGKLHRVHQSLEERVAERTGKLEAAIAERRQTEQALRSSKKKYKTLYESSHDAIMVLTPEEGFLAGNPSAVRLFGCKNEEEFCTCDPASLSPEHQPDGMPSSGKAQEMMAVAMRNGSHYFEWTHRRIDGGEFFATVLLTRLELESGPGLQATVRDVTQQKQAENELHKLSVAVEQSPAAVVITDTKGTIEYVNPQFTRSTGYTAEEAIGQNPRNLKSGDMAPETYRKMWETILAGKAWRGEFHNRKKNGELYWESASISPIFNPEGDVTHFLAVKEDISERKWAEVELIQAKQEAEAANCLLEGAMQRANRLAEEATAANTAKSEFLANMSHEIRTPMTAILGFAELLLEADVPDAERRSCVDTIRRNGKHLLEVINDILDISKIEAGKMAIEQIACAPIVLLNEVKSLMQVRADAKQLDFHVENVGSLPEAIRTDPTRLRQILINVVGNAIKFTETGSVRLTARFIGNPQPTIQFDVVDTGIGMTAVQTMRIFAPFVQADNSTARTYGGTGLGLTLSKRLAALLDGDITLVQSKLDEGSHFRVTVPAVPIEDANALLDSRSVAGQHADGDEKSAFKSHRLDGRILLAEDGCDNQRLISTLLEKVGADVTVVEDGQMATEAALMAQNKGEPFGLILMDMQMPVMSGYEAASMLRECGYTGPIVALTANAMADDRQKCLDAGCDDYVSKPINRAELIETAFRHLAPRYREARSTRDV